MIGIACTADEPVPTTATRRPLKSTGSCGQSAVCNTGPSKLFKPAKAGRFGDDNGPLAMTRKRACQLRPSAARTVQRLAVSSKAAPAMRVQSRMPSRRAKRSATWLAYRSSSGCGA